MTDHDWEFPHIVTVKSSAGAGKTYNLALRYLQLLTMGTATGQPALRSHICNIVAITFTNKAASEMRDRIIDWMKRIILDLPFKGSGQKPLDEIISTAAGPEERANLVRAVETDFEDLVKNYYDFKVSTIDSFVNLTLKASAFKLGLPPDFDISTESALYVDAALKECLQEILEKGDVKRRFDAFLRAYVEIEGDNAAWAPRRYLTETVYLFWKEEAKENKEFLPGPGLEAVSDLRQETARQAGLLLGDLCAGEGMKVNQGFLVALTNLSALGTSEFKGSNFFRRQTIAQSLNKGSAPPLEEWEEAWQRIRASVALLVEALSETKFSSYLDIYRLFKDRLDRDVTFRKRLILIEELNKHLQNVICEEHFIPEIYYALAERYSHFLIDEFQDTNHLQWKNIGILADEALSRGGTLFLVGDKKQAIYRWRGGKAELVDEIASAYPSLATYPVCLDTNFRSGEHIVAFNNAVFDAKNLGHLLGAAGDAGEPGSRDRVLDTYLGAYQQCLERKIGEGYVYVEQLRGDEVDGEAEEYSLKEEQVRTVADKVEALVRGIRERGVYEDRDIAVLVRRRHEAELIVRRLLEAGISVDSEFTVNVKNNPLIKELICFLRFLSTPRDDAALAGFLTGTIFKEVSGIKGAEMIRWITEERLKDSRKPLYRALETSHASLWGGLFAGFFKSAGYLPLYELFVLILKQWGILDLFPEDGAYFLHVCEMIKKREVMGSNNLTGFLKFWEGGADGAFREEQADDTPFVLKTTEGANAVRVLTIHKAKGLQFPVVILPFLKLTAFGSADMRDKGKFFVADEEGLRLLHIKKEYRDYSSRLRAVYQEKEGEYLFDEINNCYVACTRAEKELYIILTDSRRQKNYLIDYIWSLGALHDSLGDRIIEMGRRQEAPPERPSPAVHGKARTFEPPCDSPTGRDLTGGGIGLAAEGRGELRWMEKVRGKFESPEGCSREQVFAKKKGDVIHYILSQVGSLPPEADYYGLVHRGVMRFGLMDREAEIHGSIARFFAYEPFRRFFLPKAGALIYTEKELVDARGNAYKADRIIVGADEVDVIDFKTGETRSPAHVEQIMNYGRLLEEIHSGVEVRKHLLYIDEKRVESI